MIAEDATSRWVDGLLRAEDPYRFAPNAVYAVLAMPVFVVDWATPGWLGWSALAYLVVVVVLQLTGWLVTRHRYRQPAARLLRQVNLFGRWCVFSAR